MIDVQHHVVKQQSRIRSRELLFFTRLFRYLSPLPTSCIHHILNCIALTKPVVIGQEQKC